MPIIEKFIPIDSEQEADLLSDSMGYRGYQHIGYPKRACEKLGLQFIGEVEKIYREDAPKNSSKPLHDCWLKGWICKVNI